MVRRAHHVEVQVKGDLVELRMGQVVHIEGGADETRLLRPPPGEAEGVLRLDLGHLLGDLEDRADPDPLSLMPGPAWTESRCAPTMTTLSGFFPAFSAKHVGCGGRASQRIVSPDRSTNPGVVANCCPASWVTGDWDVEGEGVAQGAGGRAGDVVVDDHADRPGSSCIRRLEANGQVPRLIRAMFPAGKPVKSAVSQPTVGDHGHRAAATSPLPE